MVSVFIMESRKINGAKITGKVPKKDVISTNDPPPPSHPMTDIIQRSIIFVKISCWAASIIVNEQ